MSTSTYKCPDCGGPLGYVPTDPEQVCQKCFDDWNGMTIEELFDGPAPSSNEQKEPA